jgi:hypothetical protein
MLLLLLLGLHVHSNIVSLFMFYTFLFSSYSQVRGGTWKIFAPWTRKTLFEKILQRKNNEVNSWNSIRIFLLYNGSTSPSVSIICTNQNHYRLSRKLPEEYQRILAYGVKPVPLIECLGGHRSSWWHLSAHCLEILLIETCDSNNLRLKSKAPVAQVPLIWCPTSDMETNLKIVEGL